MPVRPPVHRPAFLPPPAQSRRDQLRALDDRRGSSTARGYGADWVRLRNMVLAAEPLCRHCAAAGLVVAAAELHHTIKVRDRPDLRLDPSHLVPLCKSCHSKETAQGR